MGTLFLTNAIPTSVCTLIPTQAWINQLLQSYHFEVPAISTAFLNNKYLENREIGITYSDDYLFEFIHGKKLLQTRYNGRIKRLIWSYTINLYPWVTCKQIMILDFIHISMLRIHCNKHDIQQENIKYMHILFIQISESIRFDKTINPSVQRFQYLGYIATNRIYSREHKIYAHFIHSNI